MNIFAAAQVEFSAIFLGKRIMTATTRNIPPTADNDYKLVKEVLVYRENEKKSPRPLIFARPNRDDA